MIKFGDDPEMIHTLNTQNKSLILSSPIFFDLGDLHLSLIQKNNKNFSSLPDLFMHVWPDQRRNALHLLKE